MKYCIVVCLSTCLLGESGLLYDVSSAHSSMFHRVVCDFLHNPFSPFKLSRRLVIAAEQLQRNPVLLGQSPGSYHCHGAFEVVKVVADEHFDSQIVTHGSVDMLEEGEWALIACSAGGGVQVHIKHLIVWRTEGGENM